eukprot:1417613-Prymnesium_polylepis.1
MCIRDRLCSLPRSSFDPDYLAGQRRVRAFVRAHATPKRAARGAATEGEGQAAATTGEGQAGTRSLDGEGLAALVTRLAAALNAQ